LWPALAAGLRGICPACGKGRIFAKAFSAHKRCPECGVLFERVDEGDFLVTMVTAYGLTGVAVCVFLWVVFTLRPDMPAGLLALWTVGFAVAFLLACYRASKGFSIAVLHLTLGLRKDERSR